MSDKIDYKQIYDNSPDMCISIYPKTGNVVCCNETLLNRLGYKYEEVMNMKVIEFYHPDDIWKVKENLASFGKTGKLIHSDFKLLKKNGEYIEVMLKFTPIKDENGNFLYSNAVWRDVTELKAAQLALQLEKEKVEKINEEISRKNKIIEEKNKNIIDSINYAERIQHALLPEKEYRKAILPESFVFFKPKDIVSGDFYWIHKKDNKAFFLVADCTGHGVPGAFMSMIGTALFNQVVIENGIIEANLILNNIRTGIIKALHQSEGKSQDGMDASLCIYCSQTNTMEFAGANNPLYIIRSNNSPLINKEGIDLNILPKMEFDNKKLYEIKADKQPIGYYTENDQPFTKHTFQMEKDDLVYLFSDGFPDQFGGPDNKKYFYKTFKKFLLSISHKPMKVQQEALDNELKQWMGNQEQIDDICIVAAKFQ